jgi:hypothetical protein
MWSPYYDINGNFLGVDEKGWNGDIYIIDEKIFNKYKKTDGTVYSKDILPFSKIISSIALSEFAISKIATSILEATGYVNRDNLHNGSISVSGGSRGGVAYGFNDPVFLNGARAKGISNYLNSGKINVTMAASAITEFNTVESIQSYLGIHEYKGHGIKRYDGSFQPGEKHYLSYLLQVGDKSFKGLSESQKGDVIREAFRYMYYENRNTYNYHQQAQTPLYQLYLKYYQP